MEIEHMDEYAQIRQDIRDLRAYIESQLPKYVLYTEYAARHTDMEKDIADLKGAFNNHVKEGTLFIQTLQQERRDDLQKVRNQHSIAFWNIMGYIVVIITSSVTVEVINIVLRK